MWIKINNQVVNSTLIRHISQIEEASPERFHADKWTMVGDEFD